MNEKFVKAEGSNQYWALRSSITYTAAVRWSDDTFVQAFQHESAQYDTDINVMYPHQDDFNMVVFDCVSSLEPIEQRFQKYGEEAFLKKMLEKGYYPVVQRTFACDTAFADMQHDCDNYDEIWSTPDWYHGPTNVNDLAYTELVYMLNNFTDKDENGETKLKWKSEKDGIYSEDGKWKVTFEHYVENGANNKGTIHELKSGSLTETLHEYPFVSGWQDSDCKVWKNYDNEELFAKIRRITGC